MIVQYQYSQVSQESKEKFHAHMEGKIYAFMDLMEAHYPDSDTVKLDVHLKRYEKHNAFECELILHLPGKSLLAEEAKHSEVEAADKSLKKLEQQMIKHFKKLSEK